MRALLIAATIHLPRRSLVALWAACTLGLAAAAEAPPLAADPALEARVMAIADELRCLVCQNETLAASHAGLAVDLRRQIRERLGRGETPQQITDFMVERYGEFVLYRPRFSATTALLWLGPFVLLLVAGVALVLTVRRRPVALPADLAAADESRARSLLGLKREASS